jgi:putative addiction module killer protein
MANGPVAVAIYATVDGRKPFQEWVESLKNYEAKARVFVRLGRVRLGNPGDCKPVGDGVSELRVKTGPGYRVYFGQDGRTVVVLLCGGAKATQRKDIAESEEILARLQEQETCREACYLTIISSSLSRTAAWRRHTSTQRWRRTIRACFFSLCGMSRRPEE